MIQHHPEDEWLVALAAGRLEGGQSLLVAVHLEGCAACRARLHALQAVGGELLAGAEPVRLATGALDAVLARIDATPAATTGAPAATVTAATALPPPPPGLVWPSTLRDCAVSRWHWMGPGMRWSRLTLPYAAPGSLFLLHISPGRSLPKHTHQGVELTQVLCGTFHDGRALFGPGDFDATDEAIHHQPVVEPGAECVCLAYVGGRLAFDGWIASAIGRSIGM